jgi:hypothetical protein
MEDLHHEQVFTYYTLKAFIKVCRDYYNDTQKLNDLFFGNVPYGCTIAGGFAYPEYSDHSKD